MIHKTENEVILENNYLEIKLSYFDQCLKTEYILNKLTNQRLEFENSDEFEIRFLNSFSVNAKHLKVEKIGKTASKIRFYFYQYKGIQLNYVVSLVDNQPFLKTYLELQIEKQHQSQYVIDSIDLNRWTLKNDVMIHNESNHSVDIDFDPFYAQLGQPVYIGSFYFGNEFPLSMNCCSEKVLYARKYLGKSINAYQLNSNTYIFDANVIGVSKKEDYLTLQTAFYDYLSTIKLQTKPQFLVHLAVISSSTLMDEIKNISSLMIKYSLPPVNSFVLQQWSSISSVLEEDVTKFPTGMIEVQSFVQRYGSKIGLDIPLLSTDKVDTTIEYLENNQLGGRLNEYINVADRRYIKAVKQQLSSLLTNYHCNILNIDGLLRDPLPYTNDFALGGGYRNMYSLVETHEMYIEMIKTLRQINPYITIFFGKYVNLSPFYLQYIDGFNFTDKSFVAMDEKLQYYDQLLHMYLRVHQYQIPLSNIVLNDDLIVSENNHYRDYRAYLYFIFARGTQIHSFHLNEDSDWNSIKEVVHWAEINRSLLQKSRFIGNTNQIYGYISESQEKTILALRNASNQSQSYSLKLINDSTVYDLLTNVQYDCDEEITLEAQQIVILETTSLHALKIQSITLNHLVTEIEFNQVLRGTRNIYFNNEKVEYTLGEDYRRILIKDLELRTTNEIVVNDESGTIVEYRHYFKDNIIVLQQPNQYQFDIALVQKMNFSLSFHLYVDTFSRTLIRQKNNIEVLITNEGYIAFELFGKRFVVDNYKLQVPQHLEVMIRKQSDETLRFFINKMLYKTVYIPGLNNARFSKELLQTADIVSELVIEEL